MNPARRTVAYGAQLGAPTHPGRAAWSGRTAAAGSAQRAPHGARRSAASGGAGGALEFSAERWQAARAICVPRLVARWQLAPALAMWPAAHHALRRWLTRGLLCFCAGTLLGACETAAPPPPTQLFLDGHFSEPPERIDADEVFALSEEMKHYVHFEIASQLRAQGRREGLISALYKHDQLQIEYDSAQTRTAARTFAARKGNCLSLVIMTAAFAKELGLPVTYQWVYNEDTWSRTRDIVFLSTHVNLTLGRRSIDVVPGYDPARVLTVDFLPANEIFGLHVRPISEATVVAMYMNNRAAEALAQGSLDDAYWWARGALLRAPDFDASYNTLGVVYLRHGDLAAAEAVLGRLLARNSRDKQALSNQAIVLQQLGRSDEAQALRDRLARLEPYPPYHFYFLGMQAMKRGDFRTAKIEFAREVDRADYNGEFHFWLGLANLQLGNLAEARRQISQAMASSTTNADRDVYAAKLARLHSYGVQ